MHFAYSGDIEYKAYFILYYYHLFIYTYTIMYLHFP